MVLKCMRSPGGVRYTVLIKECNTAKVRSSPSLVPMSSGEGGQPRLKFCAVIVLFFVIFRNLP